jgi:hypothetical protein
LKLQSLQNVGDIIADEAIRELQKQEMCEFFATARLLLNQELRLQR